jgi:hypothetical protein
VSFIQNASLVSFVFIPVAIGMAILKYRLYDIDLVINKTVVYGAMAAFITAVYVAIVVGIGHAEGSSRNLGLSIAATALVAVGFQPVRERVQRFANRLVYGKRASPYEVLSEFSGGMSHAVATEDLLPRMARIVAEGAGAARADVWLHVGPELVREATWPQGNGQVRTAVPVSADGDPVRIDDADAAIPVRHQGELLGVIGVRKSPGEAITPAESKLLQDLASQAGLVLRNVRLIEELKTSRQRLVTAQDEERRRLERDPARRGPAAPRGHLPGPADGPSSGAARRHPGPGAAAGPGLRAAHPGSVRAEGVRPGDPSCHLDRAGAGPRAAVVGGPLPGAGHG